MMRILLLSSFLLLLCLCGVGIADMPEDPIYYPGDSLLISPVSGDVPSSDKRPPVEEQMDFRSLVDDAQYSLISSYNHFVGLPSAFITETLAFLSSFSVQEVSHSSSPAGNSPRIPTRVQGFCSTPSGNTLVQPSQNSRNLPVTHAAPSPSICIT